MLRSVPAHARGGKILFVFDIHIIDFQMEKTRGFYSHLNKEHNSPIMGRQSLKLENLLNEHWSHPMGDSRLSQ